MYTPGQVSKMLDIAPSTLRRYAAVYADHLSPQRPGHKRGYTEQDIAMLRRIKDLVGHVPPDDIPARLGVVEDPPADTSSSTLALIPEIAARFDRLEAAAQQITQLSARIERLEASSSKAGRLERLEAWAALPWWKRLFIPPPTE